ncbi:geranylgeranyl reductase family protein [Caldivirga maquilingensis]|uniref:Geranylgeranyl reductase n=1 Tax=Caldivirga maquilingensis (strain ATCC 700844 / DSM 13496 / JCM 10307 / IC-167) TaxID=397948 RepID=A8ME14_CALMQ|nr:geranylgeranyl reductase family protein [Caldivirga maquilingensis]ABW02020.1 geranylgeranyl reductase [Caldivirga maquilingensis IC-167]
MYDLIIIGSGPAGNAAALVASRLGVRALIIDKSKHPRVKPCGGGLTPKTIALSRILGLDLSEVIEHECGEVLVVTHAGSFVMRFKEPMIRVSRRERLDEFMFNEAVNNGVEYVNDEVLRVRETPSKVEVIGRSSVYEAKWVIGADGAPSRVGRSIGVMPRSNAVALMNIASGNPIINTGDACILDFTRIKWGYAWLFPLSHGEYDVGLGSALKGRYSNLLLSYVNELGLKPGRLIGHLIPYRPPNSASTRRVMLTGDALGLADPVTGEGIFQAMMSGALAALSLRSSNATEYYDSIITSYLRDNQYALTVAYVVYGLDSQFLSRFLKITGFSEPGAVRIIEKVTGGKLTYRDAVKEVIKSMI